MNKKKKKWYGNKFCMIREEESKGNMKNEIIRKYQESKGKLLHGIK
jgi:hypothetical protein